MSKTKFLMTISALGIAVVLSGNTQADDAECGIWLCLPTGFPGAAGCAASHAAMLDRVSKLKSPLPAFSSCSASGNDEGHDFQHGVAAFVPAHNKCIEKGYSGNRLVCTRSIAVEASHIHGTSCSTHHESGIKEPAGCTRTDQYVRIFANGKQEGETYYW